MIIGTERPRRPEDFQPVLAPRSVGPCVLCEGREAETPPELYAQRATDGRPNGPAWRVRVVPNKFPTLRVEGEIERRGHGVYDLMNGVGAHELVIESPRHDDTFASLPVSALGDHHSYQERMLDLRRDVRFRSIVVFKNVRNVAMVALDHPHARTAAPAVPPDVAAELPGAELLRPRALPLLRHPPAGDGRGQPGRARARPDRPRAFAARSPFGRLLPAPSGQFEHDGAQRRDLARALRLAQRQPPLPGAPMAFVLHSAPFGEARGVVPLARRGHARGRVGFQRAAASP